MEAVHIVVYESSVTWDEFFISASNFLSFTDDEFYIKIIDHTLSANTLDVAVNSIGDNPERSCLCNKDLQSSIIQDECKFHRDELLKSREKGIIFKRCCKVQMNGYLLSMFLHCLKLSDFYRSSVISYLVKCRNSIRYKNITNLQTCTLVIQLRPPSKDVIDYKWNDRMVTLALERRELDHAMAWLSTLGGAFSTLGDQFDHCALVAGRISIQQLKLALRLGDPLTVARCKLFVAISLLQRGFLRQARHIIKRQYLFAATSPVIDARLIRMCHGIWEKLRYTYYLRSVKQKRVS